MSERGYECILKLGVNTIAIARSCDPTFSAIDMDTTARADSGWRNRLTGLKELQFTSEMVWVPTNTGLQAIENAFRANTSLAFEITDDDGWGWSGDCLVTEFHPGPQDMETAVMCSITCVSIGSVSQMTGTT